MRVDTPPRRGSAERPSHGDAPGRVDGGPAAPTCVIFSYHTYGPGARKTDIAFISECLARRGYSVRLVTVRTSLVADLLKGRGSVPPGVRPNRWSCRSPLMCFFWRPLIHPARLLPDGPLSTWLIRTLFPFLLPERVLAQVRSADLILVESSYSVMLFRRLRRSAPAAKIVYLANDRIDAIGMHRAAAMELNSTASDYDLVRIPARSMRHDFKDARVAYIPHGVDMSLFDRCTNSPYRNGTTNAVLAGDMRTDLAAVDSLARAYPAVTFHLFGGGNAMKRRPPNVTLHGEVGFDRMAPYIKFADVGLAAYRPGPNVDYLAESSLKLLQYGYARIPVVAPDFLRINRNADLFFYDPARPDSICGAFGSALNARPSATARADILDWEQVTSRLLQEAGLTEAGFRARAGAWAGGEESVAFG